jgi:hypothetical protein
MSDVHNFNIFFHVVWVQGDVDNGLIHPLPKVLLNVHDTMSHMCNSHNTNSIFLIEGLQMTPYEISKFSIPICHLIP